MKFSGHNAPRIPVRLIEASRRFGHRTALEPLSLTIEPGTAVGLVGPNGAGKTTLMRLVVGLMRPSSGMVELFGAVPGKAGLTRVGYMAQAEAIYGDLSPAENVRLFATLYGLKEPLRSRRIDEVLRLTDLSDRRDDRTDTLSGGMRRRVSLACSVVHEPELVLLDEPTAGVDPELRAAFWDYFLTLKQRGTTLMVTTHHLDEANRCDRLLLLKDGRIIADGPPRDLLAAAGVTTIEEAFLHFARRLPK